MAAVKQKSEVAVIVSSERGGFQLVEGIAGRSIFSEIGVETELKGSVTIRDAELDENGKGFHVTSAKSVDPDMAKATVIRVDGSMNVSLQLHDGRMFPVYQPWELHLVKPKTTKNFEWAARTAPRLRSSRTLTKQKYQGHSVYRGPRGGLFIEIGGERVYI
jgi:hypothetical protein